MSYPRAIPYAILGRGRDVGELQTVIDAATHISRDQIARGRAPLWWDQTAVYKREEQRTLPGVERIQTAEELANFGAGDCDDHAPTLAASLQVCGIPARARVITAPGVGYHVVVEYIDPRSGERRVCDPSARRGMLELGASSSSASKKARRRARAKAFLNRAAQLSAQAMQHAPASLARRGLLEAARAALATGRAEESAAADDDDDYDTESNEDD